jgi:hypothetical protein
MLKSENRTQPLPRHCQFSIHKSFYCDTTQMNVITTRSKSSQNCWWRIQYTAMLCHVDFLTVDTAQHPRTPRSSESLFFIHHTLYICNGKYITSCLSLTNINIVTAKLKSSCHPSYTWRFNFWVIKGENTTNKRAKIGTRRHDSHMTLSCSRKEIMHTGHHKAGTAWSIQWSGYMTGKPRFKSQQKQEILLSSETSRPTLGTTQPHIKWVQGALTSGAKTWVRGWPLTFIKSWS